MIRVLRRVAAAAAIAASGVCSGAPAAVADPESPPATIAWMDWSAEAFARAASERKPILLYVAARWTRTTLWMNQKVLTDPEVIRLANEKWIPIRVDRDRRPDIDFRYQLAVETLNPGHAGWPLVVFLMDTGEALFGASYLSAEDRFERRGLRYLLERNANMAKAGPDFRPGARALVKLAFDKEIEASRPAAILPEIVDSVAGAALESIDAELGGFGPPPRYLPPHVLELAATISQRRGDGANREALVRTLDGIERGAIYDRIGGGFHRLAIDRAWRMPEFEKLLSYNAGLLQSFILGWQATGREDLRRAAERTVDYLVGPLADPAGGFYVAQWAAASADEPKGLHYAWTAEEFKRLVPESLSRTADVLFEVRPEGERALGPPPRSLLYLAMSREEAARRLQTTVESVLKDEESILRALAGGRATREPLPLERAIYVDSTSAAVVALLEAHRSLQREDARAAALKALDRLVESVPQGRPLLHRVQPPPDPKVDPPLALDHMMLARAAIEGYEATGEARWLAAARGLVDRAVSLFWDAQLGGFFDVAADPAARGYLAIRRRVPGDTAYPSLNSLAARVLDRLWLHTGEAPYRSRSEACLKALIAITGKLSLQDAGLALALESHLTPPARYVIVGPADDEAARGLWITAGGLFDPGKVVQRLVPGRDDTTLERLGLRRSDTAYAVICRGERCAEPVRDSAALKRAAAPPPGGATEDARR